MLEKSSASGMWYMKVNIFSACLDFVLDLYFGRLANVFECQFATYYLIGAVLKLSYEVDVLHVYNIL